MPGYKINFQNLAMTLKCACEVFNLFFVQFNYVARRFEIMIIQYLKPLPDISSTISKNKLRGKMQIALEHTKIGGNTGVRELHVSISGIPKFGQCECRSNQYPKSVIVVK